jgi:hypothetical protein
VPSPVLTEDRDKALAHREAWVKTFNLSQIDPPLLRLDAPGTHTIKMHSGQYRKVPFIGDEEFLPGHVYLGKRGALIYCFEPSPMMEKVQHLEVGEDAVNEVFPGFSGFVEKIWAAEEGRDVAKAKEEAARLENAAHERAVVETRMQDQRFGSW